MGNKARSEAIASSEEDDAAVSSLTMAESRLTNASRAAAVAAVFSSAMYNGCAGARAACMSASAFSAAAVREVRLCCKALTERMDSSTREAEFSPSSRWSRTRFASWASSRARAESIRSRNGSRFCSSLFSLGNWALI